MHLVNIFTALLASNIAVAAATANRPAGVNPINDLPVPHAHAGDNGRNPVNGLPLAHETHKPIPRPGHRVNPGQPGRKPISFHQAPAPKPTPKPAPKPKRPPKGTWSTEPDGEVDYWT